MAEPRTIACEDCGAPYETSRQNTKYCRVCRLLRDVTFLVDRRFECWICDEKFAPLSRNAKFCGSCNPRPGKLDDSGTCAFCNKKSNNLIHKDVKVCRPCATDPENRRLLIKALAKKQAQNRANA